MLSHAIEEADFADLDPAAFAAEWKWDGIRVQAVAGRRADGHPVARLYSRTGEDISASFPDLVAALTFEGALDGELLIMRDGRVQSFIFLARQFSHPVLAKADGRFDPDQPCGVDRGDGNCAPGAAPLVPGFRNVPSLLVQTAAPVEQTTVGATAEDVAAGRELADRPGDQQANPCPAHPGLFRYDRVNQP